MRMSLRLAVLASVLAIVGCAGREGGGCTFVGSPASLVGTPLPPQAIPSGSGITTAVTVSVSVTVDSNGALTSAQIQRSSGDMAVDAAALALVRTLHYQAGTPSCGSPAIDTIVVSVPFSPSA
ncbi:MAG: TonB family protein [bacterium]|nr:TonB family protein [bacterium]